MNKKNDLMFFFDKNKSQIKVIKKIKEMHKKVFLLCIN